MEMDNEEASTTTTTRNPDSTKHQLMLDRLSARHQTRLSNRKSDSSPSSSTDTFLSRFTESKHSIESKLTESKLIIDPSQLKSHLITISTDISNLDKLLAEYSYTLPSYQVRSSLKAISELKQTLDSLNDELIPKNKFSFRKTNKVVKKESVSTNRDNGADDNAVVSVVFDLPGFRNEENNVLERKFDGKEIGEFTLSNLDTCEVKLIGCVNALFMNGLRNCKVFVGAVLGSVLIEEAEDCVFVMASHQIRIHSAKRCDFYLRVRSRPIIEDCTDVRFAPFCLEYDGIDEDLKNANLDEETGNWGNVDDFKWLRAVQSPNWSVLPDDQRIQSVKI
ncbi:hypothetical protein ACFE04_020899 [Oxalis oulophora]